MAARSYSMDVRARSAAETRERILGAVIELARERFLDEITLDAVAERAATTAQTILRRFGSRDSLLQVAADEASDRVRSVRGEAPAGDRKAAVRNLIEHYERDGELALHMLAQEARSDLARSIVESGRRVHREWVGRVFEPIIGARPADQRARTFAALVAICDVYFWKVLHHDLGLPRADVERTLVELVGNIERGDQPCAS